MLQHTIHRELSSEMTGNQQGRGTRDEFSPDTDDFFYIAKIIPPGTARSGTQPYILNCIVCF